MAIKIALTGATGFLGYHILTALRQQCYWVRCLVRPESQSKLPSHLPSELVSVDFNSFSDLKNALEDCAVVIHALGRINGSADELHESNVLTTQTMVQASKDSSVQRFIFISSVAAIRRHGPYGQSKFEAEEIIRMSGLPYLFFRPAYLYGNRDSNTTAWMKKTIEKSMLVPVIGGGLFKLQPVYIQDFCKVLLNALIFGMQNKAYTIAGPSQITLRNMLEIMATAMGKKRLWVPVPLKPLQLLSRMYLHCFPKTKFPLKQILELDKHEAFDISDTKRDLDFTPRPFEEGIHAMMKEINPCAA